MGKPLTQNFKISTCPFKNIGESPSINIISNVQIATKKNLHDTPSILTDPLKGHIKDSFGKILEKIIKADFVQLRPRVITQNSH
jgi:hypothetical protein